MNFSITVSNEKMTLESLRQDFRNNQRIYFDPIVFIPPKEIEKYRKNIKERLQEYLNTLVIDQTYNTNTIDLLLPLHGGAGDILCKRPDYAFKELFLILNEWVLKLGISINTICFQHSFVGDYWCGIKITLNLKIACKQAYIYSEYKFENCIKDGKWKEPLFKIVLKSDLTKYKFMVYFESIIPYFCNNELMDATILNSISKF